MKISKNHGNCAKMPRTRRRATEIHHTTLQLFRAQHLCACLPRRSAVCTQKLRLTVQRGFCVHAFSAYRGKTRLLRAQGENVAFACTVFLRMADFARKRRFCVHRFLAKCVHRSSDSGVHAPCVTSLACTLGGCAQRRRAKRTQNPHQAFP